VAAAAFLQTDVYLGLGLGDVAVRAYAPGLGQRIAAAHCLVGAAPGDKGPKLDADAAVGLVLPRLVDTDGLGDDVLRDLLGFSTDRLDS